MLIYEDLKYVMYWNISRIHFLYSELELYSVMVGRVVS